MVKVTDYIAQRLVENGTKHVFMITGGGAMHLNDSLGKRPGLEVIFQHHEQACAIAAEGCARRTGRLAVVNVTTGPGGLNTLTGVLGQWTDSVPVLYISGQVKQETTIHSCLEAGLRQLGDQEVDIIRVVKPITKFAASVTRAEDIRWILEKAIYLATHGRPGPVWVDVPMDIQGAKVDAATLSPYDPSSDALVLDQALVAKAVAETAARLSKARRPVLVAGHGVRLAGAQDLLLHLAERLQIPVLSTFNGLDLIPSDHPLAIGRIGTLGNRAGNFALQNSDVALFLGTRNNIRQVSYNWKMFARHAFKIVVDIDAGELRKPTMTPDLPVWDDAKDFLEKLDASLERHTLPKWGDWLKWCGERKRRYPVVLPQYRGTRNIHPYFFVQSLTNLLGPEDTVVAGDGTACVALFQAGIVRRGQRIFYNSGCAAMGYDLSAAIGACIGNGRQRTICLAGDGSLMLNIQELQTVVHHQLPIKLFVFNNQGYISIKQTQRNFFGLPIVGCDAASGLSFPDFAKLGAAYGLKTSVLSSHEGMEAKLRGILEASGPVLCDVQLESDYTFAPKLSSERLPDGRMVTKPLEDMFPFLDREELKENMLVPLWEEPQAPARNKENPEPVKR